MEEGEFCPLEFIIQVSSMASKLINIRLINIRLIRTGSKLLSPIENFKLGIFYKILFQALANNL